MRRRLQPFSKRSGTSQTKARKWAVTAHLSGFSLLTKSSARIIHLRLSAELWRKELPGLAMSQSPSQQRRATLYVVMVQAKMTRTSRPN